MQAEIQKHTKTQHNETQHLTQNAPPRTPTQNFYPTRKGGGAAGEPQPGANFGPKGVGKKSPQAGMSAAMASSSGKKCGGVVLPFGVVLQGAVS